MRLVPPKGKVEAKTAVFSARYGYPYSFTDFLTRNQPRRVSKLQKMEVTVNQQKHQLEAACSVAGMLAAVLGETPKGIAVAVNQNIVPRSIWADRILQQGDQVMLIKATQGG